MKLLFQSKVLTNRVVVCYLALGYVEESFYFKYQKNEAVTFSNNPDIKTPDSGLSPVNSRLADTPL